MENKKDYMLKQYEYAQAGFNDIKSVNTQEENDTKEYKKFKSKIQVLEDITNIDKAKEFAKEILHIDKEKTFLTIGSAKCVVISRGDVFRLCLDNDKEYICYNIIKQDDEKSLVK